MQVSVVDASKLGPVILSWTSPGGGTNLKATVSLTYAAGGAVNNCGELEGDGSGAVPPLGGRLDCPTRRCQKSYTVTAVVAGAVPSDTHVQLSNPALSDYVTEQLQQEDDDPENGVQAAGLSTGSISLGTLRPVARCGSGRVTTEVSLEFIGTGTVEWLKQDP